MPIFTRRSIQKLLNENREFLTSKHMSVHVDKLNSQNAASIATTWEIVLLNALSKIGNVFHERDFGGKTCPDIYFESYDTPPFIADITALSDDNYDKENPIIYFLEYLNVFFNKVGLTTSGLSLEVDSEMVGEYRDRKIKLALPEKNKIPSFIKKEFLVIREAIKYAPNLAFRTTIKKDGTLLTVTYNPNSTYSGINHAKYTVLCSLTRNPLYNALKRKAIQLRNSGFEGIMGVFVCDGGCDSLNKGMQSAEAYTQADIIRKVFINNATLSFVMVLSIEEWGSTWSKYIKGNIYSNPKAKYQASASLFEKVCKIESYFPVPETMPINAKNGMEFRNNKWLSFYRGFTMCQDEIKISSRMITELLAGILNYEKFDSDQKQGTLDKKNMIKDFFLRQYFDGKMIENISIEKCQEKDDDWIRFKYGSCDTAVSKFK